ncbi:MAG: DUF3078 domain-containing protein [Paludibacter sp.]|nr:DUF3078 domain-containing protein [Paludibacter sp.]
MKYKGLLVIFLFCFIANIYADQPFDPKENPTVSPVIIDTDSLLDSYLQNAISNPMDSIVLNSKQLDTTKIAKVTILQTPQTSKELLTENKAISEDSIYRYKIPKSIPLIPIDSLIVLTNPFFIDLVFMELPLNFNWKHQPDFSLLYFGIPAKKISDGYVELPEMLSTNHIISDLRRFTRNEISRKAAHLYCLTFDQLPDPNSNKNYHLEGKQIKSVHFVDDNIASQYDKKIEVRKAQIGPWYYKANALGQFSQNHVSENWYQGGNSNFAVLGILAGKFNYDNKKSIQWENMGEWRMGFNSIDGDTIRMLSTNDDIFKINSKLGIKAGGNWFYSGSVDFSTQFFRSYKGVNSMDLKASFLTPIRLNVGAGLDYKYKKIFSLLLSPISYKYIYVNDTVRLNQNLFGVKKGQNYLSEIGSSFKAVVSYPLTREIQLDSKLSFYTNYEKVEIDWELVCNMTINRFMSTRISLNPRYDNTIIGEKAGIQFKQLLSVGFSHKFY